MASRREFIQTGIAASVFPLVIAGGDVKPLVGSGSPFYLVIFDKRFDRARAFAAQAESLGAVSQSLEGDPTSLWYNDLHSRLRLGPVALAGVTLNSTLFCLDELVRRYGMRVVHREEHAREAPHSHDDFGRNVAQVVHHVVQRSAQLTPPTVIVSHLTPPEGHELSLVSWVIVPAGARMAG